MNIKFLRLAGLSLLAVATLTGCGGGADTSENPVTSGNSAPSDYSGPQPSNADIQAFRVEFWQNIRGTDRCGNCHVAGNQSPTFARSDDVNAAYQQATSIVDRNSPSQSALVLKVAGGHNCWLADPSACASILTRWISSWVGASATGGREIELLEPTPKDPGTSKRFPTLPTTEFTALWTYLRNTSECSSCHRSNSSTAQSPYFASDDQSEAYIAAMPRINLDTPAASRMVLRLRNESHNCWTGNCAADADNLQALITAMSNAIQLPPVDANLITSKALTLYDGTKASGGNRFENNVIALYEFQTMGGTTAFDTSGVDPAADLQFSGQVDWVGGWGINLKANPGGGSKAQAATASSRKFQQMIGATGEYSIEAWVIPGNVTQENARIVSYSGSNTTRNFTMGQNMYNYDFFNRSTATGNNGTPALSTADAAERLQASLQHVVMTFDPVNGRRIFVNGEFTGDMDGAGGGTIGEWDNSFAFVLGNETSADPARQWLGVIRLVAVHNRALTLEQVQQNFAAGVGEKYFMLFGVSHITNIPKSYVMFESAIYDSAGYLFTNPKFISLDPTAKPGGIRLKGMRIGLNGAEPQVGQAYRLLDMPIEDRDDFAANGASISSIGTIIGLERGPDSDEFFLCFDQLGTRQNVCSEFANGVAVSRNYGTRPSDIGVRTFDEINATMAKITGVDPNNASIKALYADVRQSLPATSDIQAFVASHQSSVAQLAIQYCHVMTDTPSLRSAFYSTFTFPPTLNVASAGPLFDDVIGKVMGASLATQPAANDVRTELETHVIPDAAICGPSGCTTSAQVVLAAKAVCSAVLGSAVTLVK
jgi:Concanavalin A-like lectin/glucanases superfamily